MPESSVPRRLIARLYSLWGGAYAVVERDFLVTTSTRRFLGLRLGVALISAIVVAIVVMANRRAAPDEIGRMVFGAAVVIVPLLLFLISPATGAPAISSEREGGTLDLVLAAPVSPGTFVLAKFVSRFLAIAVLVFAMLPLAATCFLFGGVPLDTFMALVVFCLAIAAFCVAAGLLFSAYLRSPAAAVLGSFLFVLLSPPAPLALLGMLKESGVPLDDDHIKWLLPSLPYYAWVMLGQAAFAGQNAPAVCWHHPTIMAGATAVLLYVTTRRMRREGRVATKARRVRLASGLFLGHPLIDRAVRGSLLWHPRKRGLVIPALALIGDGLLVWAAALEGGLDQPWLHISALGSISVLAMLRTLTTTAGSLASERKRGSLDLVMAAPFRPAQIVYSVIVGALMSSGPLFLLGLLHGTAAAIFGVLNPVSVLLWATSSAGLLVTVGALGVCVSSSATSPTRAALWSFGIFFGSMAAALLLAFIFGMSRLDEDITLMLLLSLPPVLAYYVPWVGHALAEGEWYRYDGASELFPIAALMAYVVLAVLLIRQSIAVLERRGD